MTIVLFGGTGKTGARVADRLTTMGADVRVESRGTTGFDWDRDETWPAAVVGATAAYVAYAPDLGFPGAGEAVRGLVTLALAAGCRRVVLLSGRGEPEAQAAEQLVRDTGAEVTVIRCAVFAQNFSESFLLPDVLAGELALPAGDVGEPFVDLDDVADVAARVLIEDGHAGRTYELTGPDVVTFAEAAAVLTAALGRPVTYRAVAVEDFRAALPAEVPTEFADLLGFLFDGHNAHTADGVRQVLGRDARSFAEYVRGAAGQNSWLMV